MAASNGMRETIALSQDDLGTAHELQLNTTYRFILREEPGPKADLNVRVTNYRNKRPLEDVEYQLRGCGRTFSGKTRKGGMISHGAVPAGCYTLEIQGRRYTVPTDPAPEQVHLVYVVADVPMGNRLPEWDEADLQGLSDEEIDAIVEAEYAGIVDDAEIA